MAVIPGYHSNYTHITFLLGAVIVLWGYTEVIRAMDKYSFSVPIKGCAVSYKLYTPR